MAVDDLWHLERPEPGAKPCGEHGKDLVPSSRHGRGKRWRVRYTDPQGAPKTQSFTLKTEAERFDANTRADVNRGTYIDVNAGKVTFGEFAEEWRANQVHADTTALHIDNHFRNHVLPVLGQRELRVVRPSAIQSLVKTMSLSLAPSTVEVIYRYVSSVFRAAVVDERILKSPCVGISLPEVEKKRIVPLPRDVVDELRAGKRPKLRALDDVGAMAGLRQGEAFGLEVPHIDFLRKTLRVDQQLKLLAGRRPFLAPPKSRASRRTIPIGQTLVDRLAAHLAEFPVVETEIEDRTGPRPVIRTARFVFLSARGLPLRRNTFGDTIWSPAQKAARASLMKRAVGEEKEQILQWLNQLGEATFHDLRHFYASALIAHGASVTQVQARLGHATAQETLNTYAHLWPDEDDRTRTIIDAVFAPKLDRLRAVP